jgi:hypothetical protein
LKKKIKKKKEGEKGKGKGKNIGDCNKALHIFILLWPTLWHVSFSH